MKKFNQNVLPQLTEEVLSLLREDILANGISGPITPIESADDP